MKQKFSILLFLLLLWFTGSQAVAQNAPNPFDIEQPSLRVFLPAPELATGRAVVACPGGGYSHLAVDHEGYDWAPYFNKQGIALIVLKYRMPNGDRTLPISDVCQRDGGGRCVQQIFTATLKSNFAPVMLRESERYRYHGIFCRRTSCIDNRDSCQTGTSS